MPSSVIIERSARLPFEARAERPSSETGDWFVLRTRSRQEKIVAAVLDANGIDHCLLLLRTERRHGGRTVHVALPLFPGFLFLRGSLDDAYFANRTGRVAQIITVADQRRLDMDITALSRVLGAKVKVDPIPYVNTGTRATIHSGPLSGIQGLVEDRTRLHRLILPFEALGQAISVEVDPAMVEAAAN